MNKLVLTIFTAGALLASAYAQTPDVTGFTKLDLNILAAPAKGTVMPTDDGGYFMSTGSVLTKYDGANAVSWTHQFNAQATITTICSDGQGGVIVTGSVRGTLKLGNDSLQATYVSTSGFYQDDAFVARLSSTAKVWWNRLGEYTENLAGHDNGIDIKVSGNKVYWLALSNGRNVVFNGQNYPSPAYSLNKAMLVQMGMDGTVDWVNMTKGGGLNPRYLAVSNGDVFYTSYSLGSSTAIDFGNSISLRYNQASHCAVKFNNTGVAKWAVTYDDDNSFQNMFGASADDEGNFYVAGQGSNFSSSYGIRKAAGYLIKINGSTGAQVWTRILSNSGIQGPVFSSGKIYVAGNTVGTTSGYMQSGATDSILFKSSSMFGASEQFVVVFDKLGNASTSLKSAGGLAGGTMDHLQATDNRVIMPGIYSNNNVFGSITIPATGGNVGAYFIGFFNIKTGDAVEPTGLKGLLGNTINAVYPNPANNIVIIEAANNNTLNKIDIIDMAGKKVMTPYFIYQQTAEINISALQTGVYFITIETEQGISTQKLIKN